MFRSSDGVIRSPFDARTRDRQEAEIADIMHPSTMQPPGLYPALYAPTRSGAGIRGGQCRAPDHHCSESRPGHPSRRISGRQLGRRARDWGYEPKRSNGTRRRVGAALSRSPPPLSHGRTWTYKETAAPNVGAAGPAAPEQLHNAPCTPAHQSSSTTPRVRLPSPIKHDVQGKAEAGGAAKPARDGGCPAAGRPPC